MADFSDLLLKIAQNRNLTPSELDDLGRFGRETQSRNAFVGGNTTAHGTLNVPMPFFPIYSEVLQTDTASLTVPIPSGYKHLMVMGQVKTTEVTYANSLKINFNGDTGTNYREQYHGGQNASASIGLLTGRTYITIGDVNGTSSPAGTAGGFLAYIPFYSGTIYWKQCQSFRGIAHVNASGHDLALHLSGFWQNTNPVNSISFSCVSNSIASGGAVSVYGLV